MIKRKSEENFLEVKPLQMKSIAWSLDDNSLVTLEIENKGIFNRIAQIFFKKPRISYVHLDEMGSFLWQSFDGEKDLVCLGEEFKAHFGEKAEPLYPRIAKYVQVLESYGFVTLG